MTPQQMLEQMIDKATIEFMEIAKEEEEDGFSDAMVSMERTEAYGYANGLSDAYHMIYNKLYVPVIEGE